MASACFLPSRSDNRVFLGSTLTIQDDGMTALMQQGVPTQGFGRLVRAVADRVAPAGVFARVEAKDGMLVCGAKGAAAAFYRISEGAGRIWVELVTPDRWLSQSIEQDLVHTGDKMDELVEEELVDLGYTGKRLPVEHFRSEDKLFTFRTALPLTGVDDPDAARMCEVWLLAYEACFRRLGDMDEAGE